MVNPAWDGSGGSNNYLTYTFHPNLSSTPSYTITDSNGVVMNALGSLINTGPLLTAAQVLSITHNGQIEPWRIFNSNDISNFYVWSSGEQSWSRYYNFKDSSNNITAFSAPLQIVYTKPDGSNNFLQYLGGGNLQGISGKCIDQEGNTTTCGNNSFWQPDYNIPSGTRLSLINDSNTEYWVKPLVVSQSMNVLSEQDCQSDLSSRLTDAFSLNLPSISEWTDPNLGDMPSITNISVIDGVNQ
jgi:hypothetical protein